MALEGPTQLELTDVYSIAEKVGEEFQRLIRHFGATHLTTVIPTVVGALEHLEHFLEENHKLEIRNRKLMLKVDSLACEKEQRLKLSIEVDELQYKLEMEKEDNKRLASRIERLLTRNEDLAKQVERLRGTSLKPVPLGKDPLNAPLPSLRRSSSPESSSDPDDMTSLDLYPYGSVVNSDGPDRLQFPRMSKRLSQVELELQKTRRKLVETHHSLHSASAENRSLKTQLEESRAEAALQSLENSRSELDPVNCKTEHPKFYKKDLLTVLKEKNELKEELEAVRDELNMAKDKIKQLQAYPHNRGYSSSSWQSRSRSSARVRAILDSLTESVKVDQATTS